MSGTFEYDVFLSHNQADKLRVRRLAERLRAAGLCIWLDEWIIPRVLHSIHCLLPILIIALYCKAKSNWS